jgi:hypothetical protein
MVLEYLPVWVDADVRVATSLASSLQRFGRLEINAQNKLTNQQQASMIRARGKTEQQQTATKQ